MRAMMKRWGRRAAKLLAGVAIILFLSSILWVALYRFVDPPFTPLMLIRQAEGARIDYRWTPYESLPNSLLFCVIMSEDRKFFEHHGFDTEAIQQAWANHQAGERGPGASTITQQVAKNCFLWPGRSWARKGIEAYLAVLIELIWSKERILEVYMNVAETGEGIFGAAAAADRHFGKPLAEMTLTESALLAAALPSPRSFHSANPSQAVLERQAWILQRVALDQIRTARSVVFLQDAEYNEAGMPASDLLEAEWRYRWIGDFDFTIPEDATVRGLRFDADLTAVSGPEYDDSIVIGPAIRNGDGTLEAQCVPYTLRPGETRCVLGGDGGPFAVNWDPERINSDGFGLLVGLKRAEAWKDLPDIVPDTTKVTVYFTPNWDSLDVERVQFVETLTP